MCGIISNLSLVLPQFLGIVFVSSVQCLSYCTYNMDSIPALLWVSFYLFCMSTGSYGFDEDDEEEVEDSNTTMLKKIECEGHRLE